jgi:Fe-S cluster assembly protein SufB
LARSLDEVDPELLRTFDRLGIPLAEQKRLSNVAVDAVFDAVSIATTFKKELREHGIIFCSISEAVRDFPDLVRKHLGSVVRRSTPMTFDVPKSLFCIWSVAGSEEWCSQVPVADNYYAALNAAVFSDGSFVFIPKGVKSPMEISTYFRINASETGQVSLSSPLRLWQAMSTPVPAGHDRLEQGM